MQVASALSVAHAAGVVHRDLKPENVMLRPDGIVKVLDFGLAKLVATDSGGELTQTAMHTEAGKIVGTVRYMSPEQARGVFVDARTDVWSLGVVLYEMLAGQPPFTGASATDVLAAILDRDPPPLTRFDPDTPAELTRIVGKAIRKDPDQRYQVMKDLLLDLHALRDELASSPGSHQAQIRVNRNGRTRLMLLGGAAAAVAVAAGIWSVGHKDPASSAVQAPVDRPLTRLTLRSRFPDRCHVFARWPLNRVCIGSCRELRHLDPAP